MKNRSPLILLLLLSITGCAGLGHTKLHRAKDYRISSPETWKSTDEKKADQSFLLPSGARAILISSCENRGAVTLPQLTKHLLMGTRNHKNKRSTQTKHGKVFGLETTLQGTIEKLPLYFRIFVTQHNGCVFDFTLVHRQPLLDGDTEQFHQWIASFDNG